MRPYGNTPASAAALAPRCAADLTPSFPLAARREGEAEARGEVRAGFLSAGIASALRARYARG